MIAAMADGEIESVPSTRYPDALAALDELLVDGVSVRAAVAFATDHGVGLLREIVERRTDVALEIVVRAADATTPTAIESLAGDVGATVSVVIGPHARAFHPKLWLIESANRLTVLSGSGNLTSSGLRGNDEQFELFTVPTKGAEADAQAERFERLTANAYPFDVIHQGAAWRTWLAVLREQDHHRRAIRRSDDKLARFDPLPSRDSDKAQLLEDLEELYRTTLQARLLTESGRTYNPSRFGQALGRARNGERDPITIVTSICRHRSGGFDVLQANDRRDLTVEQLVLDATKPYHDLFGETTRALCRQRLQEFDDATATEVGQTQTITPADIDAGLIRVPARLVDRLPAVAGPLEVILRGHRLHAHWNPMHGPDRDRSGRITVGHENASAYLRPNETLTIHRAGQRIELA